MLLVYKVQVVTINVSSTRIKCFHVHFPLICSSCSALITMPDSLSFSIIREGSCTTYRALSIGGGVALHTCVLGFALGEKSSICNTLLTPLLWVTFVESFHRDLLKMSVYSCRVNSHCD